MLFPDAVLYEILYRINKTFVRMESFCAVFSLIGLIFILVEVSSANHTSRQNGEKTDDGHYRTAILKGSSV